MRSEESKQAPTLPGMTLVKLLGSGGYADVYLYEQAMPRMRVAVKVLSDSGLSAEVLGRFTAEANAMALLADHPYIVQVFRADTAADGRPYIVMKYYPQRNLGARSRTERLTVAEVLTVGVRIASAVETAHRAGILHRDIKPANILTSQYGEPGLADFGIASTKENRSGEPEGMSIPWAAPEVVFSLSPADERSDVYSLGATLWHLLVGRSPFEIPGGDNSSLALMRRVREQVPPRTGRDDVPQDLERLIGQAMAKDPNSRPSSALELAKSLQAIEVANRWNPTPLDVLEDIHLDAVELPLNENNDLDDDKTRLRGAQRIAAQRQDVSAAVYGDESDGSTTRRKSLNISRTPENAPVPLLAAAVKPRVRVGIPNEPEPDGTIRRPALVSSANAVGSAPVAVNSSNIRLKRGILVGSILVVLVGLVGVGILATSKGVPQTTTTSVVLSGVSNAVDSQIGVPVVTITPSSTNSAVIAWTYSNAQKGDRFRVQVNGGQWVQSSKPSLTVLTISGKPTCAVVQVARQDGSATSPISPPTCTG